MLIEFFPQNIPENQKEILFNLKMSGVTPIIAHPERYVPVQKNPNLVYNWLNAGCIIQVDAGSTLGLLGKSAKEASQIIIKQNWCQVLGSDAHDTKKRNFVLKDAIDLVKNWVGQEAKKLVYDNPKAILNGQSINTDNAIEYSKIRSRFWNKI